MKKFTMNAVTSKGFVRNKDLDFGDDGTKFAGYSYKGIPVTVARYAGDLYLAFRLDYLKVKHEVEITMATRSLTDKFNGVTPTETTAAELVEAGDLILAELIEMGVL